MGRIVPRVLALAPLVGGALAAGCARQRSAEPPPPTAVSAAEPTIFTDSALFALHCAQADSGLTLAVRRCTPRDQSAPLKVILLPPR